MKNNVEVEIPSIEYSICDRNGTISRVSAFKDTVGLTDGFYLKIDRDYMVNNGVKTVKLKINYELPATATLWAPVSSSNNNTILNNEQPVVIIERDNGEDEIEASIPEFDLALRKYITEVKRNSLIVATAELDGRTPNIIKTPLNNETDTTAEYQHRKDPVPVQTGDIVSYTIEIFNEGDVDGRATQIIDYLPEGLEFYQAISTDYNFAADGRKITITPKNSTNLAAYNKNTQKLESVKIQFECRVTKTAARNSHEILTNIAEITECYDSNNVKRYLKGDDRDSIPKNLSLPDLPSYIGNASNSNLDDKNRNSYFKGQEDDDDFEKLKVTTPEFDLSLRKYITSIDGKNLNQMPELADRVPNIDTTPLKNNEDTASYMHRKDPIIVGIGSKIVYTITVYNEAETEGYVTVIEDYLPVGLEMVPVSESTINRDNLWEGTGNTVTTRKLDGQTLRAYDGGNTLDSKSVQIECIVTEDAKGVLTNIAQINGASRNDDRDSTPRNADKLEGTPLEKYKGYGNKDELSDRYYYYKGKEDDDDFEKVEVFKPEFDLALRKFITHVDGNQIAVSREPVVDTTPLKNKTAETAIYTHSKTPLKVNTESIVRYTIRVYNEGEADGYVTEIEDYLPEELELVPLNESEINRTYGWIGTDRKIDYTGINAGRI